MKDDCEHRKARSLIAENGKPFPNKDGIELIKQSEEYCSKCIEDRRMLESFEDIYNFLGLRTAITITTDDYIVHDKPLLEDKR